MGPDSGGGESDRDQVVKWYWQKSWRRWRWWFHGTCEAWAWWVGFGILGGRWLQLPLDVCTTSTTSTTTTTTTGNCSMDVGRSIACIAGKVLAFMTFLSTDTKNQSTMADTEQG